MSAMFELAEGGIGVQPDPEDNPDGHHDPHSDAGVQISLEITNVGDEAGSVTMGVEIDDEFVTEAVSDELASGETTVVYINLGRLTPGEYTILVYVNPGSGQRDYSTHTVTLP